MKVKTSELIDEPLNWAVAVCEKHTNLRVGVFSQVLIMDPPRVEYGAVEFCDLRYSYDWAQGGPIIERERIDVVSDPNGAAGWLGRNWVNGVEVRMYGPTPLIAAMRCFVASKLGDEIDVPEELL